MLKAWHSSDKILEISKRVYNWQVSYFWSDQNLISFLTSLEYPTAKFQSNLCSAKEGEKPLGKLLPFSSHCWAVKDRFFQVTGNVLAQDTLESSKSSNTEN